MACVGLSAWVVSAVPGGTPQGGCSLQLGGALGGLVQEVCAAAGKETPDEVGEEV